MDNKHDPREDYLPYGFTEREVAFKLLAAHALVDAPFFRKLWENPREAAAELHIALTEQDVQYLQNEVDWNAIDKHADEIRASLKLEMVTNSW